MEGEITFQLTNEAVNILGKLKTIGTFPCDMCNALQESITNKVMPLAEFIILSKWVIENRDETSEITENGEPLYMHNLLDLMKLNEPEINEDESNVELQKRLKKLNVMQQHKEYNKMVENVSSKENVDHFRLKPVRQATAVSGLNFALSVVAAFGITMYALQYVVPDVAIRAGIAIAVSTSLLFIEIFLAARHIEKQL